MFNLHWAFKSLVCAWHCTCPCGYLAFQYVHRLPAAWFFFRTSAPAIPGIPIPAQKTHLPKSCWCSRTSVNSVFNWAVLYWWKKYGKHQHSVTKHYGYEILIFCWSSMWDCHTWTEQHILEKILVYCLEVPLVCRFLLLFWILLASMFCYKVLSFLHCFWRSAHAQTNFKIPLKNLSSKGWWKLF